ncbi:Alanyl-tRNA synthetase [hydrothermal vent metagenome]|uniref:Alanine--tRNA ligase n=1 Tax=hydrothermal vent metagenome TaxID=652676 RepID=A0A3B0R039_9ZZZZ
MQSMNDIRAAFLRYFEDREHKIVPSAHVVPENDPTLLFTNAGMVQFKNVFTGLETRSYNRAVSAQKCIRAGGKHNDLDNVGFTARHHTFFEMLGNFSFGDYFKEEAIYYAWEFLTKELGVDASRLLATVYAEDETAATLWKKISGLPENRIIRISTSDNFWSMGDTGPCGPCSEIFYDHGEHIAGGPPGSADEDGDRFVEIWNLVFMQYNQPGDGSRIDLPKPSIDTGMGLERITAVLQGVHDNYDTDLFKNLIAASEHFTGTQAQGRQAASHRVISDHLRSCAFMLADGVMPANEGRGYVLRRIMRRAMRHANLLGVNEPLLHKLVPALVEQMGGAYPELISQQELITRNFLQEEQRFLRTLSRGMSLLEAETKDMDKGAMLSGEVAFKLYDTFGFPLDLTEDALRLRQIKVDNKGFAAAMQIQKDKARAAWKGSGDRSDNSAWIKLASSLKATKFVGYERRSGASKLLAMVVDGKQTSDAAQGQSVEMCFETTPFYAESGGQAGDIGKLVFANGAVVEVHDTIKVGGLHVLRGEVGTGSVSQDEIADAQVDSLARSKTEQNHSATHLLHAALRRRLGPQVLQKGSYVGPDRLRFDFSCGHPVSADDLRAIEREVNDIIWQNQAVTTQITTPEQAKKSGAMALFGEKYGDEVRVLSMGSAPDKLDETYSIELCGGTHVARTADIGLLRIIGESSVASGIRRIEALTAEAARQSYLDDTKQLQQTADQMKTPTAQVAKRVKTLLLERRQLETKLSDAMKNLALGASSTASANKLEEIGGISFVGRIADGIGGKDLRELVDREKAKLDSGVVAFIGVTEGRAAVCIGVTKNLTEQINAVELVRIAAAALGGKGGGGRPDMAQAGGPDGKNAEAALQAIREIMQ